MTKKLNNKGFSLVELIIVIAIMAVLVGVLAPQFIKYVESSRQSTDIDDVAEYKTAVETYVADESSKAGATIPATVTINVTSAGVGSTVDLSDLGLAGASGTTAFKSTGWQTCAFEYSTSAFTWSTSGTTANSKKPNKDLAGIFE